MSRFASLVAVLAIAGIAGAQGKQESLVTDVKTSIHRGVRFLVKVQKPDGSWEDLKDKEGKYYYQGGSTALALLALMQCENLPDDPQLEQERARAIERGLKSIRLIESKRVYVRAMQIMALAEASYLDSERANHKADRAIIERNIEWLLKARVYYDKKFIGWTYEIWPNAQSTDASNSQYALLALWYARQIGVAIPRDVWEEIRDHYVRTQRKEDGSWLYSQDPNYNKDEKGPSLTMTIAGICGLQIAAMELNGGREQWQPGGAFKNCGKYNDEPALAAALKWLGKNYHVKPDTRTYYHLYGLERAGRLTGQRFFGEHDWYREGCEFLVKQQQDDGSWPNPGGWDRWPHVNTAFALLFLSKGRTPVLISKLVHGRWPRDEKDLDWNNDRNDLRHLTEYVAKTTDMFGKKPLAWQTYDIARAQEAYRNVKNAPAGAEVDAAVVADMKQSPILYITGHEAITQRFTDGEVTLIKRFVENGGFIVAEACCGSPEFDIRFKKWVEDTWGQPLELLPSTHPVWTCENKITPGDPYKLMGLNIGCRTVMLYSPQDMSCFWESNVKQNDANSLQAFRLGVNIIAYGTGRTPPLPRLTPIAVADADGKQKAPRGRGEFRVMQIRHSQDFQPAPKAMSNLMANVHQVVGLEVATKVIPISLSAKSRDIMAEKFFYMHGKSAFSINKDDLASLEFTLRHGGLLFADACCGDATFDKSFRKFASDLFPKEKLVRVPFEDKDRDELFGPEYNDGKNPLTAANIQCRTAPNGKVQPMEPMLEGIKIDGRWVVLYSRYDIGCALERHTSPDCVGYAPESALRIATAVVRYNVGAIVGRPR
jgi:Domain of unknown function (DUF4159)/Prenyltransferase and squalene oxidase repeat